MNKKIYKSNDIKEVLFTKVDAVSTLATEKTTAIITSKQSRQFSWLRKESRQGFSVVSRVSSMMGKIARLVPNPLNFISRPM